MAKSASFNGLGNLITRCVFIICVYVRDDTFAVIIAHPSRPPEGVSAQWQNDIP